MSAIRMREFRDKLSQLKYNPLPQLKNYQLRQSRIIVLSQSL